jgi:hypothetical protein
MRRINRNYYQLTKPPKALGTTFDNIAIVPASILPFRKSLHELINNLPPGAVFLCHSQENSGQRQLLERVGQRFRQQGYAVKAMSTHQVYKRL